MNFRARLEKIGQTQEENYKNLLTEISKFFEMVYTSLEKLTYDDYHKLSGIIIIIGSEANVLIAKTNTDISLGEWRFTIKGPFVLTEIHLLLKEELVDVKISDGELNIFI